MQAEVVRELLEGVRRGEVLVGEALERLRHMPYEAVVGEDARVFARLDHHRHLRCGVAEAIFCPGKTAGQVAEIFERFAATGANVLATRGSVEVFEAVAGRVPAARWESAARCITLRQCEAERVEGAGYIMVVSAGTGDQPVAEEARVTAELAGQEVRVLYDVGVAGLHRLLAGAEELAGASVVVVVAGMEGALASVVAGLVGAPVVAVPTSVGYGASFGGVTPLLTMLSSCAAGVAVVNIDNGYGAGTLAAMICGRGLGKLKVKS